MILSGDGMRSVLKMTWRTVRTFFGRFMAILLIVALSAGFFSGLKITTGAILETGERYLDEQRFYDYRILSTMGFAEDAAESFKTLDYVESAEVSRSLDALLLYNDKVSPLKIIELTDSSNLPSLVSGRLPQKAGECLADTDRFGEDDIGMTYKLSQENADGVKDMLSVTEFEIVGLVNTPLYLGIDRGTTTIGGGSLDTFIYVTADSFSGEAFTEITVILKEDCEIYSDEYSELIDKHIDEITVLAETAANERFEAVLAQNGITVEIAEMMGVYSPDVYVLTREENAGYLSFENDTSIIGSVANIFPVFFIAIAILVCVTTMTRMVDEERTQIGVLKALGFGKGAIMGKYLIYAGCATVIGWVIGYFSCTWALPRIFWLAYNEIYNFAPIEYLFSLELALMTLVISLVCILGSTYLSCRKELVSVPAALMRPKAGKVGKRVFLERVKPIWKRLSFLQKITVRNMFRYKQRLLMMLVGIGCCAGLVVTAFGVRDSMIDVGEIQYNDLQKFKIEASFAPEDARAFEEKAEAGIDGVEAYTFVRKDNVDLFAETTMKNCFLVSYSEAEELTQMWNIASSDKKIDLPERGKALISPKIAEKLSLSAGDKLKIRTADMKEASIEVGGIFDNHIYDYIIVSAETFEDMFGEWSTNVAFMTINKDSEFVGEILTEIPEIVGVTQLENMRKNISGALDCLNYIIWLIVFFSGALAFIVIFNLTNINIAERRREIATVQVLGFYPRETEKYVLRENLIMSVAASIIGLPLGRFFHYVVMSMVRIDLVTFNSIVTPISYAAAFVCTVLFAVIINQIMKTRLSKINMAESLKAVE